MFRHSWLVYRSDFAVQYLAENTQLMPAPAIAGQLVTSTSSRRQQKVARTALPLDSLAYICPRGRHGLIIQQEMTGKGMLE